MRAPVIAAILAFVSALPASAQSLADVARKEGERRQQAKPAGKTYTNQDLKPVRAPEPSADAAPAAADAAVKDSADAAAAPGAPDAASSASQAADAAKAGKEEVKDQAYWSRRQEALREQLSRDETFADALQSRINILTMDFINRDDPIQRDQIERDRNRAIAELDRLKKTIEQDRRAIADFEDEARRAGVPPGWLR